MQEAEGSVQLQSDDKTKKKGERTEAKAYLNNMIVTSPFSPSTVDLGGTQTILRQGPRYDKRVKVSLAVHWLFLHPAAPQIFALTTDGKVPARPGSFNFIELSNQSADCFGRHLLVG